MTITDPARMLSVLLRSDDEALAHFCVRTRLPEGLAVDTLRWWRQFLDEVAQSMAAGDTAALERYQHAIASAAAPAERKPALSDLPAPASETPSAFHRRAPSAHGAQPHVPTAASPWTAPADDTAADLDATAFLSPIDMSAAGHGDPLPFAGTGPAPASAMDGLEPHPSAGETAIADVSELRATLMGRAGGDALKMDVGRYAEIVAHTESATPERRTKAHNELGVRDDEQRDEIDQHFARRFSAEPELKARFAAALERWRVFLSARRP